MNQVLSQLEEVGRLSAHASLSASIGRATRVASALPGEVRIAAGTVAFLAVVAGAMAVDWRLGIPIALALSITIVLRINAALGAGVQVHEGVDSIEGLTRESERAYPGGIPGLEGGLGRWSRSAQAALARSVSRFRKPAEPVVRAAP